MLPQPRGLIACLLALAVAAGGCGGDGDDRDSARTTATANDDALPVNTIAQDQAKGRAASARADQVCREAFAPIRDFDLRAAEGPELKEAAGRVAIAQRGVQLLVADAGLRRIPIELLAGNLGRAAQTLGALSERDDDGGLARAARAALGRLRINAGTAHAPACELG